MDLRAIVVRVEARDPVSDRHRRRAQLADAADLHDVDKPRLGLYDAMLDAVQRASASDYPLAELCKTAWQCWSEGRRDLIPGDNISAALLAPLKAEGVRIIQTQDGESYEFRHDQMRGYLAARRESGGGDDEATAAQGEAA